MSISRAGTISTRGMATCGAGFVTIIWPGIRCVRNAKSGGDTFAQRSSIISDLLLTAVHMRRAI